jgi:hypothetical protein
MKAREMMELSYYSKRNESELDDILKGIKGEALKGKFSYDRFKEVGEDDKLKLIQLGYKIERHQSGPCEWSDIISWGGY